MNIEQMKEIVNNAPDGATHWDSHCGDYLLCDSFPVKYWDNWWIESREIGDAPLNDISDLRTIIAQHEEIERLKSAPQLRSFTVIHHRNDHEWTSTVIAENELQACGLVDGEVMDISINDVIYPREISGHSWNMLFHSPRYREPTQRALDVIGRNNNQKENTND